jgi:hypothetical protein
MAEDTFPFGGETLVKFLPFALAVVFVAMAIIEELGVRISSASARWLIRRIKE